MTVPDENAPKTGKTDQVLPEPEDRRERPGGRERTAVGEELRAAMERSGVDREDFGEK
ncbi:hypothetical protein GCM10010406_33730 [Streptomyces thermolineatus]|uniref:Uncharacterized protein n=1 Tax=Streptomyces thermolineatus TaxID=44033 RepID=A0ABN3M4T5_9ACTN